MIKAGIHLQIHKGVTSDGKDISFIRKGEDLHSLDLTFGADSYIIISSSDSDLVDMLVVEESQDIFVGRPLVSLSEALKINLLYDDDVQSKWKDVIKNYAENRGIDPSKLNLRDLINESLRSS